MANTANPAGDQSRLTNVQVTPPLDKPNEFQRFEDLAGKLVGVPKEELDEKLHEDG